MDQRDRNVFSAILNGLSSRRVHLYLVSGILLIIALAAGGREIERHITAIEFWLTDLGPLGVLAFIGLFIVTTSFLLPDTVLCLIAGALFGFSWGIAAVLAGSILAGALQFGLSRQILRARIQRFIAGKPFLAAINRSIRHDEFRLQLLLRLTPINPATVNYLLGAAGVGFLRFFIALLALTPNLIIEVYFGYAGRHATAMVGSAGHISHLHSLVVMGGVAICIFLMVVLSKMTRKALMEAIAETEHRDTSIHE